MSNKLTPEEEQRSKRIIKRFYRYYYFWFILILSIFTAIGVFLPIIKNFPLQSSFCFYFALSLFMSYILNERIARFFARKLSQDDRKLIAEINPEAIRGNHFSELHHACKANFPKELLRASSPNNNNGTLLRAAANTDETPKEEMLRASNTPAE